MALRYGIPEPNFSDSSSGYGSDIANLQELAREEEMELEYLVSLMDNDRRNVNGIQTRRFPRYHSLQSAIKSEHSRAFRGKPKLFPRKMTRVGRQLKKLHYYRNYQLSNGKLCCSAIVCSCQPHIIHRAPNMTVTADELLTLMSSFAEFVKRLSV